MQPPKDTMRGYCTWLPAIMDALLRTTGPVLEVGGGYGTAILHAYCENYRQLTTVEANPEWREQLEKHASDGHLILAEIPDGQWDVALVDSAPAETRQAIIDSLRGRVKWIVVHDVEDGGYGYDFTGFSHVAMWDDLKPETVVLSGKLEGEGV